MNRSKQPSRAKVMLVQERDLVSVKGSVDDLPADASLKQHVDNPGQTAMKDGLP